VELRARLVAAVPTALVCLIASGCGAINVGVPGDDATALLASSRVLMTSAVGARGSPVRVSGALADGGQVDVRRYHGKVVVINFAASGCTPCRAEAAGLERAWHALDPERVQFVGTARPNLNDGHAARAHAPRTYAVLRDPDAAAAQLGARDTRPTTVLLDRHGRVAARVIGPGTEATFVQLAKELLAEACHDEQGVDHRRDATSYDRS
jgi:peroxiredoxin